MFIDGVPFRGIEDFLWKEATVTKRKRYWHPALKSNVEPYTIVIQSLYNH